MPQCAESAELTVMLVGGWSVYILYREQSAGGQPVLAHDDDGHLRDGTCQPNHPHLPAASPAPIQHAQRRRGGQVRRLLRQGLNYKWSE